MVRGWRAAAAVLAIGCGVGACASGANSPAAQQVAAKADPFRPYDEVSTVTLKQAAATQIVTLRLLGRRDRTTKTVTTHAFVQIAYEAAGARRYESARNEKAQPLKFAVLSKAIPRCQAKAGCFFTEEYLVDIPETELRAARQAGYRFKIFARSTPELLIAVPAPIIVALAEGMDKQLAATPAVAAAVAK